MKKGMLVALPLIAATSAHGQAFPGVPLPPSFHATNPVNLTEMNYQRNWAGKSKFRSGTTFNQFQFGPLTRTSFTTYPTCQNFGPNFGAGSGGNLFGRGQLFGNGARYGYYHYNTNWNDNWFFFSFYEFTPTVNYSVQPSPWYLYPSLPPYVNARYVQVSTPAFSQWSGSPYRYGDQRRLDLAVDDLIEIFRTGDRDLIEELMPRRDGVDITLNGQYGYTVNPQNFESLFMDGVLNVRTQGYRIERLEFYGETARIRARHQYLDPWGVTQINFHEYVLVLERRNYVIRQFGVSR